MYKVNHDDLLLSNKEYKTLKKYAISKRAITHYFLDLRNELEWTNVRVYLVHPGVTHTAIVGKSFGKIITYLADKFMNLFFHKVSKASLSTMYVLNDLVPNGTYVGPRGLFMISGYPKEYKVSRSVKKDFKKTIEETKKLGF